MVRENKGTFFRLALFYLLVSSLAGGAVTIAPPEGIAVTDRSYQVSYEVERDFESLAGVRERTGLALNAIVRTAVFQLRLNDHPEQAQKLHDEWFGHFQYVLWNVGLGDHKPLSEWLATTYAALEFLLGERVMEITHLVDLKIFNFAIPVVFACVDEVDALEFLLHFQPFVGSITYWSAYVSCVGLTWGGGFFWVCGIAGEGASWVMKTFVAPRLNEPVWRLSCNPGGDEYASVAY